MAPHHDRKFWMASERRSERSSQAMTCLDNLNDRFTDKGACRNSACIGRRILSAAVSPMSDCGEIVFENVSDGQIR